jgi:hypothetical protein
MLMIRSPSGKVTKVNKLVSNTKKIVSLCFSFAKDVEVKVAEVNERIRNMKKIP